MPDLLAHELAVRMGFFFAILAGVLGRITGLFPVIEHPSVRFARL